MKKLHSCKNKNRCFKRDVIEDLLNKLAPDFVPSLATSVPMSDESTHFLESAIDVHTLETSIKVSSTSAAGLDGINYTMTRNLPDIAKQYLCHIYNNYLIKGENCEVLKESLIIPIPQIQW